MSIIQIIIQLGSHHLCQINYKNCQFILCYPWEKEGSDLSTLILLVSTKQQYLWISLAWTLQTLSQSSIHVKLIQHKRVKDTSIWNKLTWAWVWAPLITSSVVSEGLFLLPVSALSFVVWDFQEDAVGSWLWKRRALCQHWIGCSYVFHKDWAFCSKCYIIPTELRLIVM